jgi:hypothetical protein
MPYAAKERQRQARREWYLANKKLTNDRSRERRRLKKQRIRLLRRPELAIFNAAQDPITVGKMMMCPGCGEKVEADWKKLEVHAREHTKAEDDALHAALTQWQSLVSGTGRLNL